MNDNIIDSIEWHRDQLGVLLPEDEFGKLESELDEIVEKFRLPGSKDRTKRKSKKGIKDVISEAFGGKSADERQRLKDQARNEHIRSRWIKIDG